MLYFHCFKPYLLVYLIVATLLAANCLAVTVYILLNGNNGFKFQPRSFSSCQPSTKLKFSIYIEIILKCCFLLSIIESLVALVQFCLVLYHFIVCQKIVSKNSEDQNKVFTKFNYQKLIILYVVTFLGFLVFVPIFGSFLSLMVQFSKCSSADENISSKFQILCIISGISLIFRIWCFCMLLKLFYEFKKNHQQETKQIQQNVPQKNNKKQKIENFKKLLKQSKLSIGHRLNLQLLNQNQSKQFYDKSNNLNNLSCNKSNKLNNFLLGENMINSIYDQKNNLNGKLSSLQISEKQKQLTKKLSKNHFKKKSDPKNYIESNFQTPFRIDTTYKKGEFYLQQQQKVDHRLKRIMNEIQKQDRDIIQNLNNFGSRYHCAKNLMDKFNQPISNQERRYVKRQFLEIDSKIVQFDAKNYSKKLFFYQRKKNNKLADQFTKQFNLEKLKYAQMREKIRLNLPDTLGRQCVKFSPAQVFQKLTDQGSKIQKQNPISTYIDQDETYFDRINKIQQFSKIANKQRVNTYGPFCQDTEEQILRKQQANLVLHLNKDFKNAKQTFSIDGQPQDHIYDPFRDPTLNKDLFLIKPKLSKNSSTQSSPLIGLSYKKKKEGTIIEHIRSKFVVD